MADRSSAALRRTEGLPRQASQQLSRKKSATMDWGNGERWNAMPESPRWDCMASKSRRSNRSASCDSADVGRAPVRRRNDTFSDAFESLHDKMTGRSRLSKFLTPSYSLSPRYTAASCEFPEYSRSICANTSASRLSDGDRTLLLHVADRNSRALAKRAYRMLDVMHQRPYARSSALLNGLMLSEAVPPHIDGYTLVENDRGTKIFQLDTGRDSSKNRRHSRGGPQDRMRFLGFRKVKATIAEITELLGSKDDDDASVLNPGMTEVRILHTLMDTSEERPEVSEIDGDGRYVGLSWMCMQTPSWMGWKSSRLRDFLLLEDKSSFRAPDGRHGWVQSLHSVQLPWCPSQEYGNCIVRGSMYQSGIVAIPAKEAPGCWVDVMCAVELDLKGNVSEKTHRAMAMKRLSCLVSFDQALVNQRLQRISFMDTRQFEMNKPETQRTCHICTSRVRVFGKHFSCRKCGETMCKKCSVDLRVDASSSEHKKRRVCTRCVIKRAAPEPAVATQSMAPAPRHWTPRQHHERRPTGSSGNTIGLDDKLIGLLEDAAARTQSARQQRSVTPCMAEPRNTRSLTLPLAPISEERRSGQMPSTEMASLANYPRPSSRQPSVRYIDPSGHHRLAYDDSRPVARAIRSARASSPPPASSPATGLVRGRANTTREQIGATQAARHSKGKNVRPIADRPWSVPAHSDDRMLQTTAADPDTTPPSARGSSLRVQFLLNEIML